MILEKDACDANGDRITSLVQWDQNVNIYFHDEAFSTQPAVHFCNVRSEKAIPVESTYENGALRVRVPNSLLNQPYAITAFIYINIDGGYRSIYRSRLSMIARPIPNDFIDPGGDEMISVIELFRQLEQYKATMEKASGELDTATSTLEKTNQDVNELLELMRTSGITASDDGNGNVSLSFNTNDIKR